MREQIENDIRGWDALEDHRTGTAGDQQTATWLAEQVRNAGGRALLDEFALERRVPGPASVADGEHVAQGLPLFDGPLRGATAVRGRAGWPAPGANIAVVRFESNQPNRDLHACRLATSGPTAIVAVAAGEQVEPGLAVLNAESFLAPYGPPVLQVATAAGAWLDAAADGHRELTVSAPLSAEPATASNVRVEFPGRDAGLAPLVVMTPRSAWWRCTAERGGGIAVWLACARALLARPPQRPVLLIATSGHELGHLGLEHFTRSRPALLTGAHAWLHLGANFAARGSRLRWQASTPGWLARGEQVCPPEAELSLTPPDQRPLGEARNVFDAGGAYLSLLGDNRWFHHPDDRWPTTVDAARTAHLTSRLVELALELADA